MEWRNRNIVLKSSHLHLENDSNSTKRKEAAKEPLRKSFFEKVLHKPGMRHSRKQMRHNFSQGVCNCPMWLQKHLLKQQQERKFLGKGVSASSCTHMPFFLTQIVVTVINRVPAYYSNSSETIHFFIKQSYVF